MILPVFFIIKKDRKSFENLSIWIEDVKHERENEVLIFIVGNKIDDKENR
jgi:GTPase SAR1 family protein